MRILTVVGARPQFIKAAMVSRAIAAHNQQGLAPGIDEQIVHTGQHYDDNMSEVFFRQLGLPAPAMNLQVGSASHGAMTAHMLEGIEKELIRRKPDQVLVYGDTNSTLAGALAAAKLHIPVAHVEAGLRSFNKSMPEEINRILADHVSSLLFCPTRTAVDNLAREGIAQGVHHVGDVMYDAALHYGQLASRDSTLLDDLGLAAKGYLLATVHRAENTDDASRLKNILAALEELAVAEPVVLPVHPRTRARLSLPKEKRGNLRLLPPVSFLDMIQLEKNARVILTDSGGVQKEAYFHQVPCVTLREETEWVETVQSGWNTIAGNDPRAILHAVSCAGTGGVISDYGRGESAADLLRILTAGA